MASEFTWVTRITTGVGASGSYRYYRGSELFGQNDPGLTRFGVEFLDSVRHTVIVGMQGIQRDAFARVTNLSRVKTGEMRDSVQAQLTTSSDIIRLGFGWENDSPKWAKWQEFGTSSPGRGITPMLAVSAAFEEAERQVQDLLKSI